MIVYPISELALSSVPCPTLSLYNYMIRGGCRLCISFVFSVFGSWHMVQEAIVGNSTKVCHTLKTKRPSESESLPVTVEFETCFGPTYASALLHTPSLMQSCWRYYLSLFNESQHFDNFNNTMKEIKRLRVGSEGQFIYPRPAVPLCSCPYIRYNLNNLRTLLWLAYALTMIQI